MVRVKRVDQIKHKNTLPLILHTEDYIQPELDRNPFKIRKDQNLNSRNLFSMAESTTMMDLDYKKTYNVFKSSELGENANFGSSEKTEDDLESFKKKLYEI